MWKFYSRNYFQESNYSSRKLTWKKKKKENQKHRYLISFYNQA